MTTHVSASNDTLDTAQLRNVLMAFKKGDLSVRMPVDRSGVAGKVADTLNDILDLEQQLLHELRRINVDVGKEGKISQRVSLGCATGGWSTKVESMLRATTCSSSSTTSSTSPRSSRAP
jgi:hypothetical protein